MRVLSFSGCLLLMVLISSCNNTYPPVECTAPNSNVHYKALGITYNGVGDFNIAAPGYRMFSVAAPCNPQEQMHSILKLCFPIQEFMPDTPHTFHLTTPQYYNGSNAFALMAPYDSAFGEFTVNMITSDSLATGTFFFYAHFTEPQTYSLYDEATNAINNISVNQITIQDGTFMNVKIYQ